MLEGLAEQVIVVTGSGKGLGRAIADDIAANGGRVVHVVRSEEAAAELQDAFGDEAAIILGDVNDTPVPDLAMETALNRWGRLDGLVNNAGVISPIGRIADVDPDEWGYSIATNLVAPYRLVASFIRAAGDGGTRRIVNVSSGAAHRPIEGWSAYCAGKAGLAMLTRQTQLEYGSAGILSFGLIPGLVDTDMQGAIRASGINEVSQLPREALRPASEPARVATFLLSGAGDALAGREIDIRDASLRQRLELPPL
ncbi:SDR family NAD(P)-dependent oxidoreductase [Rhodoligotrophos defluvii]|uniref:SDR family NAD(P)-dependent oxidoreductase n=1 Tax=Rhodoligotrophos defluvii TaxID=2561934 RepID=UPI0010C9A366|nr:SDR family NAD(P)-dependent oxidoreductase [Rhodoligotrophos defluvii]